MYSMEFTYDINYWVVRVILPFFSAVDIKVFRAPIFIMLYIGFVDISRFTKSLNSPPDAHFGRLSSESCTDDVTFKFLVKRLNCFNFKEQVKLHDIIKIS